MATTPTPPTSGSARRPRTTAPAAAPAAPAAATATAAATPTAAAPPATPPPPAPGGPTRTPPPAAPGTAAPRSNRAQNIGAGILLLFVLVLALIGGGWAISKLFGGRETVVVPAGNGAPQMTLPQGALTPEAPAPIVGAFRPVSPDRRFMDKPNPSIANGNADGTVAVQWMDDVGIIYPRPAGPNHTKESLVAAAQKAGLEVLARENQNCSLNDYVLVDWPSDQPLLDASGKQVVTGGVPQVVMYKVLKSPNVTGIRHKNDPPTGSAGAMRTSAESGQSQLPNRPMGPPGLQGRGPNGGKMLPMPRGARSNSGGQTAQSSSAGNTSVCPNCGDRGVNTPPKPFPCRKCGEMIR